MKKALVALLITLGAMLFGIGIGYIIIHLADYSTIALFCVLFIGCFILNYMALNK